MSTKIEDLSDIEEEELYEDETEDFLDEVHEEDLHLKKPRKENFEETDKESINSRIVEMLVEKIKHPVVVTFIMLLLTHPLFIKGIFRIPYVEVADGTIGVNVILSILGGILFFLFKEFM